MSNKNNGSSGIGLCEVLTIIFVILKLVGVIDWSWWWVLSPALIGLGLWLILAAISAIYITRAKRKIDKWKF